MHTLAEIFPNVYLQTGAFSSVPSRFVLILFEQYGDLKSFSKIFIMHILCDNEIKWSNNTLVRQILSRERNMFARRHQISIIFRPSPPTMKGFHVFLNYLTLRKWYTQKTSGYDFLEGLDGKRRTSIF